MTILRTQSPSLGHGLLMACQESGTARADAHAAGGSAMHKAFAMAEQPLAPFL